MLVKAKMWGSCHKPHVWESRWVGRKETPLHLRPCYPFPLAYGKSCRCVTVPLQPNRTAVAVLQETLGTLGDTWNHPWPMEGACWIRSWSTSNSNADLSGFSKVWYHHWASTMTQVRLQLIFVLCILVKLCFRAQWWDLYHMMLKSWFFSLFFLPRKMSQAQNSISSYLGHPTAERWSHRSNV